MKTAVGAAEPEPQPATAGIIGGSYTFAESQNGCVFYPTSAALPTTVYLNPDRLVTIPLRSNAAAGGHYPTIYIAGGGA
jgi:hypothetical protein